MVYKILLNDECPAKMEGPPRDDPAENREDDLDTAQKLLKRVQDLMEQMRANKLAMQMFEVDLFNKEVAAALQDVERSQVEDKKPEVAGALQDVQSSQVEDKKPK